jgi:two-component SAPR family response regulator
MIRVLLVDDEEDALDLLEILLDQIGDVEVVGKFMNPVRAIEALRTRPADAVFLDNQMPGMTGMEAARQIRAILPHIPIVFTTAYAEYAVEAFEVRSTDYLLKPIAMNRLQDAVARLRQAVSAAGIGQAANVRPWIRCMGGFSIALPHADNRLLAWKTNKEKEVCAFLIHREGTPADTALIIESIWPGYDLEKAKMYFYTCLSYLRKTLQKHAVPMRVEKNADGFVIRMDGAAVDAAELERTLDAILSAEEPDERLYDKITGLYKGDYMEGCDYGWALARQETVKVKYIRSLRSMHRLFRKQGRPALQADCLQRVLAIAPESEADGRELIRLHLETGNRNEARRVYRQLKQVICEQLGAQLEEETIRLLEQIGWSGLSEG